MLIKLVYWVEMIVIDVYFNLVLDDYFVMFWEWFYFDSVISMMILLGGLVMVDYFLG